MNLRNNIKKVLNEENRFLKTINRYVDKYGIYKAPEIIGISLTEMVKLSNHTIDSKLAYHLIYENFINEKLKRKYKEFKLSMEYGDLVSWFGQVEYGHFGPDKVEQFSAYATPFFEEGETTPIEISWYDLLDQDDGSVISIENEGKYYYELKHKTEFESIDELFDWYDNFYLPRTYDVLITDLIPKARNQMEELLDR
jgi:hypothetical protein